MHTPKVELGAFVNAVKIVPARRGPTALTRHRLYRGWLTGEPVVGQAMTIWRNSGRRIITSRVLRVLGDASRTILHVQTENSTYVLSVCDE